MADVAIVSRAIQAAPKDYTLSAAEELLLKAVSANIDGSASGGPFLPAVQMVSPDGTVMWTAVPTTPIAAGGSAVVSWFPGGGVGETASTSAGPASVVESIVSPASTIAVTSPQGPTTSIDLPATGVAAGTYGDATNTAQVTVTAEGVVTGASQVPISGLSGSGLVKLFDSTLGADALTIDTGAGAIPSGHGALLVYITVRTARAGQALDTASVTFNGDVAAHYWRNRVDVLNTVVSAKQSGATPISSISLDCYGAAAPANAASTIVLEIPGYDGTTFLKSLLARSGAPSSTDANSLTEQGSFVWASTAAITQLTLSSTTGSNLVAGSRMQIYGVQ